MLRADAFEAIPAALNAWRAVEAQHVVATRALVDTLAEQEQLERILEGSKPPLPQPIARLHWLLFTPFRYAPPPVGSRFRARHDPGVFYAADEIRTACAELGYWRWRHLLESPQLTEIPQRPQTVFQTAVAGSTVDLREAPWVRQRRKWVDPGDYRACQDLASRARSASVALVRYESVRDPDRGGCVAVLDPAAFSRPKPLQQETWLLSVSRQRVTWVRSDALRPARHEFEAAAIADWATGPALESSANHFGS
jgi:hypothetical protein